MLNIPKGTYPIRLEQGETVDAISMPDGRILVMGTLSGRITLAENREVIVAMLLAFVPGGEEKYMTVSIGEMGGSNAEFVFGRSFVTPDLMDYVREQMVN